MLENISRGTKLGKGLTILKKISYGENWCLYQTFANDTILCVKSELANKWIKVGLVSLDIFNEYAKNTKILFIVGTTDLLKDEIKLYYNNLINRNKKYIEIPFASHGFLNEMDKELEIEVFSEINKFI